MGRLVEQLNARALELGIPLGVQLDVTYRCNERCVHCYLDHEGGEEMSTGEILDLLRQLADAGTLFLTISGGEPLLRPDLFEIVERARSLTFSVKLKTNGILIGVREAARLRELAVGQIQISIYSHRAEVHDGITKVKGSLERSLAAIRFLRSEGLNVGVTNVLMRQNAHDHEGVRALALEAGATFSIDPTITPHINGDRSLVQLNISRSDLVEVFHNPDLVGRVDEFCGSPPAVDADVLDSYPCSAGHTAAYVAPNGDVYPCVQFPLPSGNVRERKFLEIWRHSPQLLEVRSIQNRGLNGCSACGNLAGCTRCPGLAYMEGDMRGPSSADCEKSLVRTGIAPPGTWT